MLRRKYIFDVDGEVSHMLSNDFAEIQFLLNGNTEKALLKKGRFYHNGRLTPDNVPLSKYLRIDMQVKFSCHILEPHDGATPNPYRSTQYNWYVVICMANNQVSPLTEVSISRGLFAVIGTIIKITKRHGVLATLDDGEKERRIAFLASKVYLHGKRFSSSRMLNTEICLDEKMVVDGVPCIPEEDRDNCEWFATCAFQGKRPRLANPTDTGGNEFQANFMLQKPNFAINTDSITNGRLIQYQMSVGNIKSRLQKIINLHTSNPRTLFTTGYGYIFEILNDEFGIILGCFKKNVFQSILFHRKNAFLFKVPLARAKLTEVFLEGDRMKFIAVGAPANFFTEWIAVQVSVPSSVHRDEDSVAV